MALTRKMLKAMGIEDEKIDQIIESHSETVDALKKERDNYKEKAEEVPELKNRLEEAEAESGDDGFREKYEAEHEEFEKFKSEVEKERTGTKLKDLYKELLKETGVDEKRHGVILRATDFSELKLDDKGKLKDHDKLVDQIKEDWGDFIVTTETKGSNPETPPPSGGSKMTKKEIKDIKDPEERQQAIADNHELFGF